jgi:hypothetical protein
MFHADSEAHRQMAREHAEALAREYRAAPASGHEERPARASARAFVRRLRRFRAGRAPAYRA